MYSLLTAHEAKIGPHQCWILPSIFELSKKYKKFFNEISSLALGLMGSLRVELETHWWTTLPTCGVARIRTQMKMSVSSPF